MKIKAGLLMYLFLSVIILASIGVANAAERNYSVTLSNYSSVPIALEFANLKEGFEEDPFYQAVYEIPPDGELKLFDSVTQSAIGSQLMQFVGVVPFSSPVERCQILLFNETKGSLVRFKYLTLEGEEKKVQLGYRIENKRTGSDERGDYHKDYFIIFRDF